MSAIDHLAICAQTISRPAIGAKQSAWRNFPKTECDTQAPGFSHGEIQDGTGEPLELICHRQDEAWWHENADVAGQRLPVAVHEVAIARILPILEMLEIDYTLRYSDDPARLSAPQREMNLSLLD